MSAADLIVAYGLMELDHAVQRAIAAARGGNVLLVVGITPYTHTPWAGWLVGLSWAGSPVAWVSAHQLKEHTEEQAERVVLAAEHHDLTDDTAFAAIIEQLIAQSDQDLPPVSPAVGHD